jgi:hypothetical protein
MATSRAQKGCVYPGWTRGPAVVDSDVGYLDIAGSQGPCPRACRVGALSIACCGVRAGTPVSWVEVQRQHQSLHNGLRRCDSRKCTDEVLQVGQKFDNYTGTVNWLLYFSGAVGKAAWLAIWIIWWQVAGMVPKLQGTAGSNKKLEVSGP